MDDNNDNDNDNDRKNRKSFHINTDKNPEERLKPYERLDTLLEQIQYTGTENPLQV